MVAAIPLPFALGFTTTVWCLPASMAKLGTSRASGASVVSVQASVASATKRPNLRFRVIPHLHGCRPAPSAFSADGPLGPRVDIQRSLPPLPPGRLEVKISVPPSRDRTGCESTKGVLSGAPRCSAADHASWMPWRVNRQMSKSPNVPVRLEDSSSSCPSVRTASFWSVLVELSSVKTTAGPSGSPSLDKETLYMSCVPPTGVRLKYYVAVSFPSPPPVYAPLSFPTRFTAGP